MPAAHDEVVEAMAEGVQFHFLANPIEMQGADGEQVSGMTCIRMQLGEPDASGRRRPEPIEGSEFHLDTDTVIVAIGQYPDLSFVAEDSGLQSTRSGMLEIADCDTMQAGAPDLFAGGDVAGLGPLIAIQAVADGLRAARGIDALIQGCEVVTETETTFRVLPEHAMASGYQRIERTGPPLLPVDMRALTTEVESAYPGAEAAQQALRCLKCHVQTVFDGSRCILCGGCVDVCPEQCLKMVRLDRVEGDAELEAAIAERYGLPLEAFWAGWSPRNVRDRGTAMIKDETRCIRCGLCARRCPTGAISMESSQFCESLVRVVAAKDEVAEVPAETAG
jgi:ferredoxin